MKSYINISWKYMKNGKKMRILTVIGIIIATMLITALGNLFYSTVEDDIEKSKKDYGDYKYRFERVTKDVAKKIEGDKGVKNPAVARDEGYIYLSPNGNSKTGLFIGLNSLDDRALKNIFHIDIDEGDYPKNSNEVLLSRELFKLIASDKKIGDTLEVPIGNYPFEVDDRFIAMPDKFIWKPLNTKTLKIVGITKNEVYREKPREFIDYTMITFLDEKEKSIVGEDSYKVFTKIHNKMKAQSLANKLGVMFITLTVDSGYSVEGVAKSQVKFQGYTDRILLMRSVFFNHKILITTNFITLFVVAMIYNAFNISLLERVKQFGILRCIGATRSQVNRIVMVESLIILLIAIPVGLLLGTFGAKGVLYLINHIIGYNLFYMKFYAEIIIFTICVISLSVIIAAFRAVIKASGLSPVEAMNNFVALNGESGKEEDKYIRLEGSIKIIDKEKFLSKWFKVEGSMAYKNVDRNKKRNKICVISLAFSIILFICLTSIFLMKRNSSKQLMASDKWNIEFSKSYDYFNDNDVKNLSSINGVKNVYKNTFVDTFVQVNSHDLTTSYRDALRYREKYLDGIQRIGMEKSNLVTRVMLATDDLSMYEPFKKAGNISKENLDEMGVIIVNSGEKDIRYPIPGAGGVQDEVSVLSYMTEYRVGDTINIPLNKDGKIYNLREENIGDNNIIKLKIVAIVDKIPFNNQKDFKEDFGIILSEKTYERVVGNTNFNSIYINGDNNYATRTEMIENIKNYAERGAYSYIDYVEKTRVEKEDAENSYKLGIVFGIMVLLLGMINVTNTLSANVLVRRKELASLRSIGMTESQLLKMLLLEGGFTGYKASFPGVFFGVIATIGGQFYLLQHKDKWAIAIWLLCILLSVILIIILTLMSTISPAKSLSKMSIVDNIKSEEA